MTVSRRAFLGTTAAIAVALGATPSVAGADRSRPHTTFGPLQPPDANGLALPRGFSSRVIARWGEEVAHTGHVWHFFPDGGACFETRGDGWVYVSNSESLGAADGGAGAIRFDRDGRIVDAYPILTGSGHNCAGGPTPWGTWLSCEEIEGGRVFECDPLGRWPGVDRPALGRAPHEAAAVDADRRHIYLTEDNPDGRLYRFTARRPGDLRSGRLEAAHVSGNRVTWHAIPDPSGALTPTRLQVPATTPFNGGEGIWWLDGDITFVTKHDRRVWRLDTRRDRIRVVYDAIAAGPDAVLGEPDNVIVTRHGDVYVCEDQDADQQVVLIDRWGRAAPVLQLHDQPGSELTGIAFNPRGDRMYVSSQRGTDRSPGLGITYEIRWPRRLSHGAGHGHDGHGSSRG